MSRLILAIISLALICSFSSPVQAAENGAEVDLTVTVISYQITDLSTSSPTRSSIYLTWTTPVAEVSFSYLDVRYSRTTITTANWDEATSAAGEPTPAAGASQGMRVTGLSSGTRYYFAMKVVDEKGLVGLLSNVAARTTLPRPVVVEVGVGAPPPELPAGTTDVRGKVSTTGVFRRSVTAISEDELCTLTIPRDTVGLTEELEPLDEITMVIMDEPPSAPWRAYIVGLAYDFGPDGATFEPPITLEYTYDPADIPEGIAEEDLVIAMWDEELGEWVELPCTVDLATHTITASVSHFTCFAVIARRPAPPPPPVPAPAAFSLSELTVQPIEVQSEEAVTITVSVANTGGTEGSYSVVLKINGVKEAEKSVIVAAGDSQPVSFSVSKEEAGSYNVLLDGLRASFTVVAPPPPAPAPAPAPAPVPEVKPPFNWPLVGGIIGGVVVVGLLIFFFVVRRRAFWKSLLRKVKELRIKKGWHRRIWHTWEKRDR